MVKVREYYQRGVLFVVKVKSFNVDGLRAVIELEKRNDLENLCLSNNIHIYYETGEIFFAILGDTLYFVRKKRGSKRKEASSMFR